MKHVSAKYPVKQQFWSRANEIKLVISTGLELDFYQEYLTSNSSIPVYLQPEWNQRSKAIPLILKLLQQNPSYRLSLQTHKFIDVP